MNTQHLELNSDQVDWVENHLGLKLVLQDNVLRLAYNCVVPSAITVIGSKKCKCGKHNQSDVFSLIPTLAALGVLIVIYSKLSTPFKAYEGLVIVLNPASIKTHQVN